MSLNVDLSPKIIKLLRKTVKNKIYFGFLYDCGEQVWLLSNGHLDNKHIQGFFLIKIKAKCDHCKLDSISYCYELKDGIYCIACDARRDENTKRL